MISDRDPEMRSRDVIAPIACERADRRQCPGLDSNVNDLSRIATSR
jgi:hypothetical protein